MTVHFVGAGPGDPDLITIRAKELISKCPVCIYAGSLVPKEIINFTPENVTLINSVSLHLDQIIDLIEKYNKKKN